MYTRVSQKSGRTESSDRYDRLISVSFSLVSLLNANYADGIDVSWIWDGNHEAFAEMAIPQVIAGGDRHQDMTLRLK